MGIQTNVGGILKVQENSKTGQRFINIPKSLDFKKGDSVKLSLERSEANIRWYKNELNYIMGQTDDILRNAILMFLTEWNSLQINSDYLITYLKKLNPSANYNVLKEKIEETLGSLVSGKKQLLACDSDNGIYYFLPDSHLEDKEGWY